MLSIKVVIHLEYTERFLSVCALYYAIKKCRQIPDHLVCSVKHYFRFGTGLPRGGAPKGGQPSSGRREGGGNGWGVRMQPTATRGPDVGFTGDNMHWHR